MVRSWALFVIPLVVANLGFPLTTTTSRCLYTQAVNRSPRLRHYPGMMQALLSMDASIAGFVAPNFIAQRVLVGSPSSSSPLQEASAAVSSSWLGGGVHRVLSPWALYAPILSLLTLVGHLYVTHALQPPDNHTNEAEQEMIAMGETTNQEKPSTMYHSSVARPERQCGNQRNKNNTTDPSECAPPVATERTCLLMSPTQRKDLFPSGKDLKREHEPAKRSNSLFPLSP